MGKNTTTIIEYPDFVIYQDNKSHKFYVIDYHSKKKREVIPVKFIEYRANSSKYNKMTLEDFLNACDKDYDYSGEEITDNYCRYWYFKQI